MDCGDGSCAGDVRYPDLSRRFQQRRPQPSLPRSNKPGLRRSTTGKAALWRRSPAPRRDDIRVAVLCGGLGTRLGELARDQPKAMIVVGGRPYLERVLESFAERGLGRFVLLTGYKHDLIEAHFGDGGRFGMDIGYSREPEPLGTGGALREARHLLGERFLLTYGDVLRRFDYDRFVQRHEGNCLAVYPRLTTGNADVAGDSVTRFDKRAHELPFIDAGFSTMRSDTLDLLPPAGACSFEKIVYTTLAQRGELGAEIVNHDFFDIGTPDELARMRKAIE